MIMGTKNISVSIISAVLLLMLALVSCKNFVNDVDSVELTYETMNFDDLYDDNLVTTSVLDMDKKYNSLAEQIIYTRMVSEHNDGSTIEDFDTIFLGKIEQDGIFNNGEEDIEWILLYKDEEKALFQSKYIIDELGYLNDLPTFLNNEYINKIFSKDEIGIIQRFGLIRYEDLKKYYGDVGIDDYRVSYNSVNSANNRIYNNKIITKETTYVKKLIHNDKKREQASFYKFQEEDNYKNDNLIIDENHEMVENYYFIESDLVYNDNEIPFCFNAREAVSSEGIVKKNFYVSTNNLIPGENNYKYYMSGLRPIIYVDLKKSNNFKLKNEYKQYNYYEIKKGKTFDISNIKNVHSVIEYPDNTYLENIESVEMGATSETQNSDNNPIEWIVLDKSNGAYLLLSKYPVALKRFDDEGRNVDYLNSSIRKWLNDEFYNNSFTDEQKKKISTVKFKNKISKINNTEDKVFLLSADDISKYFTLRLNFNLMNFDFSKEFELRYGYLDSKKLLSNTMKFDYRKSSVHKKPFSGEWNDFYQGFLLRDNGYYDHLVKYIDNNGKVRTDGTLTDMPYIPVRPAIYVSDKKVDITIDYVNEARNVSENLNDYNSIIGDIDSIFIGKCEQDGDLSNGKEDIEWNIIGKENEDVILISKYILDAEKLNKSNKICKYENSLVRSKLINLFNEYFTDEEKELLIERNNVNFKSILDGRNGSENIDEKLFILSIDDIRKFLGDTNKAYDILKSENTYYLNTRNDIQRIPNDLYLNDNYFLRSIGAIDHSYHGITPTFNGKEIFNIGFDSIFWSSVDKDGQVKFDKMNDYYNSTEYYVGVEDSLDIIIDDIYFNGIRPCIKININDLKEYLKKDRALNIYNHIKIEKGKIYSIDEIEKVNELKNANDFKTFDNIDSVKFGNYKLDKESESCDLEWFVLFKTDDKALLLSKYLIDETKFDFNEIWEFSDIRKKLNNEYYNIWFSDEEKKMILTSKVTPKSQKQNYTFDKLFLLDEKIINEYILDGDIEDEKYFQKFNRLKVSKYLKNFVLSYNEAHEREILDVNKFYSYLLNNNNENYQFDPYVDFNGQIHYKTYHYSGVRPVMWIKLNDKVIDEYEVKPKTKKYKENDTIEDKIKLSDAISKYSNDNNVEDFDSVEFGKFFQGIDNKENLNGKIYYYSMDTIDKYNEWTIYSKQEKDKLQYEKSMDKNIEWVILDKNENYAMLISKYILYAIYEDGNYHNKWLDNDREFVYAESETRKWLNEVFYNIAFSEIEKKKLIPISFVDCSQKGTNEIKTFYDNVTILNSIDLANYFGYISKQDINKKIATKATNYALGVPVIDELGGIRTLRTAENNREYGYGNSNFMVKSYSIIPKIIDHEGKLDFEKYTNIIGIRPVIKIKLSDNVDNKIDNEINNFFIDENLNKSIKEANTFKISSGARPISDTIKFGKYEQDGDFENGKEDIEWYVLKKENNKALLISKDILDLQVYDYNKYFGIKYYGSHISEWLNIKFINEAFNESEINMIEDYILYDEKEKINISTKDYVLVNEYYVTKLFILSIDEINEYLKDGTKMRAGANASNFVKSIQNDAGGIHINSENGLSPYWTRMGKREDDNYLEYDGTNLVVTNDKQGQMLSSNNISVGVRPSLWIRIN